MRIYGIYDIQRKRIVYVGKTKNSNDYKPHGKHISKIIANNPERYRYNILENNLSSLAKLNIKECFYIKKYNTYKDKTCFNFTPGGDGGFTLSKHTEKQRNIIKEKELATKRNNPDIMKEAAQRAYLTFLKRPLQERLKIIKSRFKKSLIAKKNKYANLTKEEKKELYSKRSAHTSRIRNNFSQEKKKAISNKIRNTLLGNPIMLVNIHTNEKRWHYFSEWFRQYKVSVTHLRKGYQNQTRGWRLPNNNEIIAGLSLGRAN